MRINQYNKKIGTICSSLIILIIHCYRHLVSPILPRSCRFYPSCSAYAIDALKMHGPVKGVYLAARRIVRCHPFNEGGFDPVPEAFHFFK
ncbi:MAG: membrane protein insertion efficiency factor YidD [Spirochaetes bacterium]|nr:membrane protein insertion efficiency factor YidD [Spirochaetota bacterium]